MILYILLFVSVLIDTLKNAYYNYFGKNQLQESQDSFLFNAVCCIGSVVFFLLTGAPMKVSAYSLLLSVIFAAVTVGAQYFSLLAMSLGSMSYSVLFTYLSMLIPTFFGVICYRQPVSVTQVLGLVLMIITFFLSVDLKKDSKLSLRWLIAALACFVTWGLVGVCQLVHQNSAYAEELNGFLLWTFIFSTVMFSGLYLASKRKQKNRQSTFSPIGKDGVLAILTGVVIGAVNHINLYLSGKMPGVIFFPIVNGGVIILSGLVAMLVFRERLDKKQQIGLVVGIVATCLLGI